MVLRVCEAAGGLTDSARLLCASWDTWLFLSCNVLLLVLSLSIRVNNKYGSVTLKQGSTKKSSRGGVSNQIQRVMFRNFS
jgi:hypothetical protein